MNGTEALSPLVDAAADDQPRFFQATDDEYHGDLESLSHSQAEVFRFDPALFHSRFIARTSQPKSTKALDFGTLVHHCLMRPGFWSDSIVLEDPAALSAAGQRRGPAWKEFVAAHAGKVILCQEDFDALRRILDSVMQHDAACSLRGSIERFECPAKWRHETLPIRLRCKFDGLCHGGIVLDLKTSRDSRPREFTNSIMRFGYHRQAAWYCRGFRAVFGHDPKAFVFLVVGSSEPHRVECYELDADFVELGDRQNDETIEKIVECYRSNRWVPESHGQILKLSAPAWAASDQWELQHVDGE